MKNLKTILIVITMLWLPFLGKSHTPVETLLNQEIEEAVKFEHGALSLEKNRTDFVKVSFRINEEGKIVILALNYSDEEIKSQLINKLSKIKVGDNEDLKKVYNYNFSFKKV
jgi:hypothetical protein